MVDLATHWLGLSLRSPLVIGASPLADDLDRLARLVDAGAGAVVLRSIFEEQIVNEQLAAHRFLDSYVDTDAEARSFLPDTDVFSLGPEPMLRHLEQVRTTVDVPVVASLNGITPGGWTDIARQLQDAGAHAIELNLYDVPTDLDSTSGDIEARQLETVRTVAEQVTVPVSAKLSVFHTGLPNFATRLAAAGAQGVAVFNRFYQPDIDLDTLDVDRHLTPSTSAELPLRLHALALLHGRVDLSLACTGGIHTGHDAAKALLCGADAIQLVSALLDDDARSLARIHTELTNWLTEKSYQSVDEARGAMSFQNVTDPQAWERVNYARVLQGWQPPVPRRQP